jgi:phospholipid transport system substrate-binding protein
VCYGRAMRSLRNGLVGAACALLIASLAAADPSPATRVIERLNATLLQTLKDAEALGFQGRLDKLMPAVEAAFDVAFMAEKSIGKYWKPLSDAQKARWVELFTEFTAANYAGNLKKYSGQRFEVTGEEPSQNDTTVVHTTIVDPGNENVEMNYRMQTTPAGPKIIDIYLKGTVSELALRRSDYTSVLERDGFEALVTTIRGKIDDLAAGRATRN